MSGDTTQRLLGRSVGIGCRYRRTDVGALRRFGRFPDRSGTNGCLSKERTNARRHFCR